MSNSTTRFRERFICRDCAAAYQRARYHSLKNYLPRGRFTAKRGTNPTCPTCQSGNVRSDEANRKNEFAKQNTHMCAPYPFRHEKGTLRFCPDHPKSHIEPTEEENHYYQALLDGKRTSEDSGAGV